MLWEKRGLTVGGNVIKVIELVGESDLSWEDAVQVAVKEASKTIRGITGVEVVNWTGKVDPQGDLVGYRANVQVAFEVEN
ncbi:MAG TPA: dodecin domain-containing protein [Firmicutes bacterium]|jgi:flavin-binding protein dodecin|nr:dodecin domain-containing protein [Bacillota bacterium]